MQSTTAEWVGTIDLCTRLTISRTTLYGLRRDNILKSGQHYRRRGTGARGHLTWDIAAVEQALRAYSGTRLERG